MKSPVNQADTPNWLEPKVETQSAFEYPKEFGPVLDVTSSSRDQSVTLLDKRTTPAARSRSQINPVVNQYNPQNLQHVDPKNFSQQFSDGQRQVTHHQRPEISCNVVSVQRSMPQGLPRYHKRHRYSQFEKSEEKQNFFLSQGAPFSAEEQKTHNFRNTNRPLSAQLPTRTASVSTVRSCVSSPSSSGNSSCNSSMPDGESEAEVSIGEVLGCSGEGFLRFDGDSAGGFTELW